MIWRIENLNQPEKPDKGQYMGSCNRRACQAPHAVWFNRSTLRHYCEDCARAINKANPDTHRIGLDGPLCVAATVAPVEAGG